jgi:hypothetical protein
MNGAANAENPVGVPRFRSDILVDVSPCGTQV